MSITRINEFLATPEAADELRTILAEAAAVISALDGCISCRLLRGHDNATRLVMLEEWESIEAHRTAVQRIPTDSFAMVMGMLAERPKGEYFEEE